MNDQKYISSTLYHFVGRNADGKEACFEILRKVLDEQVLKFDPLGKYPDAVPTFLNETIESFGEISNIPAVCFCDIPFTELAIHTDKYSKYGLGFKKDALLPKGVRPIWYIPKGGYSAIATSESIESRFPKELKQLFETTSTVIRKLWEDVPDSTIEKNQLSADPEVQRCLELLNSTHFFLLAEIAWYFKFYDSSLSNEDPKNYYFEREWRKVNGNVDFEYDEIEEIVIPTKDYVPNLNDAYPNLSDRVRVLGNE